MRFGKRRGKDAPEGDVAVDAPPAPDQVTDDWLSPRYTPEQSMPPPQPGTERQPDPEPEDEAEPVVEGEAFELPYEPPAPAAPPAEPVVPLTYRVANDDEAPVYEPPAPHPIEPSPAARLADSTPHHEPGIRPGSDGAWPEPAFDLAERPEILVGAAFGGGLLLALILRRFGN